MKAFQHKVALTVAWFAVVMHFIWVLILAGGMGQQFATWMMGLHMVTAPTTFGVFSWGTALWLLVVAFVFGYIIGWIFAGVYNWVSKNK